MPWLRHDILAAKLLMLWSCEEKMVLDEERRKESVEIRVPGLETAALSLWVSRSRDHAQ